MTKEHSKRMENLTENLKEQATAPSYTMGCSGDCQHCPILSDCQKMDTSGSEGVWHKNHFATYFEGEYEY